MSENSLREEDVTHELTQAVNDCLKIIGKIPHPSAGVVATVVGNVVSNIAAIFAQRNGVNAGAEIMAAINCISSKSIDMHLKDVNMDVDAFHDSYMRCLVTIAGSLKEGVLIRSNQKGEK
jgi:hypothetical protein